MRAKKAKKSPRSIRYMLSADRRLQKLSLRKMTERIKMPNQASRSARLKTSGPSDSAKASRRAPWLMSSRAIVLAAICVVGAAALIAARQPSHESDVARIDAQLADRNAPPETAPTPTRVEPKKTVVDARPPVTAAVVTTPASVPIAKPPVVEPVKATMTEPMPKAAAVDSTKEAEVKNEAAATITGCLESDSAKQTFWLSDTSGDTPKSRSWRSGFLKKRPSRIELVDAPDSLRLANHVGQRVSMTGTLENREMRASSVRRVAASCN